MRGLEFVKSDIGSGERVPPMDANLGLVDVGGGGDEIDRQIVGGEEAGEVEKLVEMTLCWKWDHDQHHFSLDFAILEIGH